MYKLSSVSATNFKGFDQIEVSFDPTLTFLVGGNGSGKSSAGLDAIWACMQGVGLKAPSKDMTPVLAERYQVIGPNGKSAKASITLHDTVNNYDIVVTRKITDSGTELHFDGPDSVTLDQRFLNEIFSIYLISPRKFLELNPKSQSVALGIDLSDIDRQIKATKEDYTIVNRQIREIGVLTPVPNVSSVDVTALVAEKAVRTAHNKLQQDRAAAQDNSVKSIQSAETELTSLNESLRELTLVKDAISGACKGFKSERGTSYIKSVWPMLLGEISTLNERIPLAVSALNTCKEAAFELSDPLPAMDVEVIDRQIASASDINVNAAAYGEYVKSLGKLERLNTELMNNKEKQESLNFKRTEKIRSFNLPFEELTIDEEGQLMLKGRFIQTGQFSTGELIKTIPMLIIASMKSQGMEIKFPYVYLQDFNLLDEDNQKDVIDYLTGQGMQLCIEMVSKEVGNEPNHIYLRSNKIVKEEK